MQSLKYLPFVLLWVYSCTTPNTPPKERKDTHLQSVPLSAEDIHPLLIGQSLPAIQLKRTDGSVFDLSQEVKKMPTVLLFYRGGWCPYCKRHLGAVQEVEADILAAGYQIIAVSPDKPEVMKEHTENEGFTYTLLSDNDMKGASALGIAFKMEESLVEKYKSKYEIDVERDSGHDHHLLPVPGIFVLDKEAKVRFSYFNPNYKERISPELLLCTLTALTDPSK